MYPYIEVFGTKISMMLLWVIIAFLIFLVTAWVLTKKNHQDFLKLFYWLPVRIIFSYILWRYVAFVFETWIYIPNSIQAWITLFSPQNFNFNYLWILLASWLCFGVFFASIKRTENKKIWADILFMSLANSIIIFWVFLTLGDSVIWNPTDGIFAIRALSDDSALTKFDGVYPVWLFISFWVFAVHFVISLLSIILKKNWMWMWWIAWILIVLGGAFLFQSYPRHWIMTVWWLAFDIKQYASIIVVLHCVITAIKWDKKRF